MKVLMTADTVGGVWSYAVDLCEALGDAGVHVTLATMGGPVARDRREQVERLGNVCLYESRYRLEWMDEPWSDVDRAGEWLLKIAEETDPGIIHLNGYAHATLAWRLPVLVVAHSCVTSWWHAVRGGDPPARYDEYRRRVDAGLRAAHAVVAPTHAFLTMLRTYYPSCPAGRVIRNGRAESGLAPGRKEPLVFAAGRVWDDAKNLATLAGIAHAVSWPVVIAGERRPPSGAALGEPPAASRLLGRVPAGEVAAWLRRASIYALPAKYEPFGLSVLEAARCGCALVLGDIATLRELWHDAALFVDPDDSAGLRAAIETLIRDGSRRVELARRAAERAAGLTATAMANGYLDRYRSLAPDAAPHEEVASCAS